MLLSDPNATIWLAADQLDELGEQFRSGLLRVVAGVGHDWFFQAMRDYERDFVDSLPAVLEVHPTGSRLFGCEHKTSDFDLFARLDTPTLRQVKWRRTGEIGRHVVTWRQGRLNLIGILDDTVYQRFMLATWVCQVLSGPKNKRSRQELFGHILGEYWEDGSGD